MTDASKLLTDLTTGEEVYLCGGSNTKTGITGLEPISKLLNKDIKEYYPYPDILSEGVRPPNCYETTEKINEIVEKLNTIIKVLEHHIIGDR